MKIDKSLKDYIEKNIFPIYTQVDNGHNLENHIIPVIDDSIELAKRIEANDINFNIVYTISAYHDTGLVRGRENHQFYSKLMVEEDKNLRKWFTEQEIKIIAEAVEDHRASSNKKPRNIYGMIIADSDKNVDLNKIIFRTHSCIKTKFPNEDLSTFEKEFEKAYEWILEKDSENGYLNFYLDKEKEAKLNQLHEQVKDKNYVKKIYYEYYMK